MKITLGLAIFYMGWSEILAQELYSQIFDLIDINRILGNPRLRDQYTACLLDEGFCTADGRALRNLLPEAIATKCKKCTRIQKINSKKVINFLKERTPQVWDKFVKKYDPTGQYLDKFERLLNEEIDSSE